MISKSIQQYIDFRRAVDKGLKVQLHGMKFVAVDRETWDEMVSRARRVEELQVVQPVRCPCDACKLRYLGDQG